VSGSKSGVFAGSVDTRFYPEGHYEFFLQVIAALEEKNASLVSFLLRDTFTSASTYEEAQNMLSTTELIADVYYIIAGSKPGQGSVLSRNRTTLADLWSLDAKSGRWFEVETNYDHWQAPPWWDNRRDPAMSHLNTLGSANLNPDNLFKIMGMKPTINLCTAYTIVACPATGYYNSYVRWCQYPCTQW